MAKLEKLDANILKKIESEAGIEKNKVKDDLTIIRNWVNQQPHLPQLEDNDETNQWLYSFLFYSKNKIEKVKKRLDTYFSCRSLLPELFDNQDPEDPKIKVNVRVLYLITLPKLTPEGYRVHVFFHADEDLTAYEPNDFMRRTLMICDWKMKEDLTAGDLVIFHMKNATLARWARYNLVTLSRFIACVTNAYPIRIKAMHFTEAPSYLSHIINSPFIPAKLKKRIKVHSSGSSAQIFENIPEDCLPPELGGTLEASLSELNGFCYDRLLNMRKWFLDNQNMKSDESKRLKKLEENDLFGCDGTFRTLTID